MVRRAVEFGGAGSVKVSGSWVCVAVDRQFGREILSRSFATPFGVLQSITLSLDLQNMAVMCQRVQGRSRSCGPV